MRGKGSLAVLALGTTTALTATALLWWRARHGRKRKLPRRGTMPSLGDDTEEPLGRFSLPLSIALRTLRSSDFSHSFLTLLEQLTEVGSIDEGFFHSRLQRCGARSNTHLVVAEDEQTGRVLASGTVVTELKLIHQCGLAGHIEDVVVDACVRRKGLGRRVVRTLLDLAREAGAYKCILDCMEHNVPFYESCGFKRKEVMMINYLDDAVKGQGPRSTALERALQPQETTQGLVVRPVRASDYSGTLLSLLSQLTVVGHVSQAHFDARVAVLGETQHLLVIEDTQNGQQGPARKGQQNRPTRQHKQNQASRHTG